MHELLFDLEFKKDLDKLTKKESERILKKVKELKENPELGKHLIGIDLWSSRVGKLWVIYKIVNDKLQIFVLAVDHRKEVYRKIR